MENFPFINSIRWKEYKYWGESHDDDTASYEKRIADVHY